MSKKEKYAGSFDDENFGSLPPTWDEMEEVFRQISGHMSQIRQTLNTQALIVGALSRLLLEKEIFTTEQMDAAMVQLHDQAQQAANAKTPTVQ
jgi:hypothetical protein